MVITGLEQNDLRCSVGSALDVGGKSSLTVKINMVRLLKCFPAIFPSGVLVLERPVGLVGVLYLAKVAR